MSTTAPPAPGELGDSVAAVWDDVVGQDAAVTQFRRAAAPEGSLAQAWLITGPPGSGRSTAARAFAATLQCELGTGCGSCRACRTTLAGTHPDVTARIRVGRSGHAGGGPLEGDDVQLVIEPFLIEVASLDRHPVLQPTM